MEEVYEILDNLPISDLEVNDYAAPLLNAAVVTYEKEQYQFSYFAVHLIFMTYIYLSVWKIGKFHKDKYEDSLLFVRPYKGRVVNFKEIKSVFEYSHLPEKDIFEFFSLIGVDNSYIKGIKRLIERRNNMAHASGSIEINTEEKFNTAIEELISITRNLQSKMNLTIRNWYCEELLSYAKDGVKQGYSKITDYISEEYIQNFSFSKEDLKTCYEFGLSKFSGTDYKLTKNQIKEIRKFHNHLKDIFNELD